jgi:hypothetical protein
VREIAILGAAIQGEATMHRIGAVAILIALSMSAPARAEGEVCRNGSQNYLPDQTLCLDGVRYTCQDNGAWLSDRRGACIDPVTTSNTKSCLVGANRTAAHGVRRCIDGKRSQCADGDWVDLGERC